MDSCCYYTTKNKNKEFDEAPLLKLGKCAKDVEMLHQRYGFCRSIKGQISSNKGQISSNKGQISA